MLIDSHQHVGYINHDASAVIDEMDRLGIDQAWILTWYLPSDEDSPDYHSGSDPRYMRPDGTHAAMPLSGVIEACRRYPDRFIPGYCPDPRLPQAPALLEAACRMHGIRICGEWSYRTPLDDPRSLNLLRKAGELGCPVVLHMDAPWRPDGRGSRVYDPQWYAGSIDALERALQACPQTTIIGHAPGFWRYLSGDEPHTSALRPQGSVTPGGKVIELLNTCPNLYADLSAGSGLTALSRDVSHARSFILKHADRLLYGRDQYGHDLYAFLQTLDLPAAVLDKLLSGNAQRLLRR
jgi:predicted TIM-barrel fold metal-dependent hydrolase